MEPKRRDKRKMAKFSSKKIIKEKQDELLSEFFKAVTLLEEFNETRNFFKDLLSPQETTMLARRLQVAEMLDAGFNYSEIQLTLKVGKATIARVQNWLNYGRGGYKTIIKRLNEDFLRRHKNEGEAQDYFSANAIKKRYAIYYWPEALLDKIANKVEEEFKKRRKRESLNKI